MLFLRKILILIILAIPFTLQAQTILRISDTTGYYNLANILLYYRDNNTNTEQRAGIWPVPENQFVKAAGKTPQFGITGDTIYILFKIVNQSSEENWHLLIDFPTLDNITCFVLDSSGAVIQKHHAGLNYPSKQNKISSNIPIITLNPDKGKQYTIILKIHSLSVMNIPVKLCNTNYFINNYEKDIYWLYMLLSIILAGIIFNLILYALIRSNSYIFLSMHLIGMLCIFANQTGILFQVFPDFPVSLKSNMRFLSWGINGTFLMLFTIKYLNLEKFSILKKVAYIIFALSFMYLFAPFFNTKIRLFYNQFASLLYFSGILFQVIAAVIVYRNRQRTAIYFLVAYSLTIIAIFIHNGMRIGVVEYNFVTQYLPLISTAFFSLLITIGLNEQLIEIAREKAKNTQLEVSNQQLQNEILERRKIEERLIESEERFKLLSDLPFEGVFINNAGVLLLANQTFYNMTGYRPNELLGKDIVSILLPESDQKTVTNNIQKEVQNIIEINIIRKDGTSFAAESFTRIIKYNGEECRAVAIRDITLRKQHEEILIRLNNLKDRVFSIIAHDLINPFNSILGFSEIIISDIEDLSTQEIRNRVIQIHDSANNAFKLLENLLEWSRSQSGKINFQFESLPLKILVQECFDLLTIQAMNKKIVLIDEIPENIYIHADHNAFLIITRNLISNAIKFSNKFGRITLKARNNQHFVEISVSDEGIGIHPDKLKELFSGESSYSDKGTENERGTGLGLILCQDFIQKHNGRIWANSQPGKGSTFTFTMPLQNNL